MKDKPQSSIRLLPKWVKISALVILFFILAGIGANFYLNGLITRQLKKSVSSSSKGFYQLDYAKVQVNLFARSITIDNAVLKADSSLFTTMTAMGQSSPFLLEGKFPLLKIRGIHWMKFIFSKSLVAGELLMKSPAIVLRRFKSDSVEKNISDVQEDFQKNLRGLKINALTIADADLEYWYMQDDRVGPTVYHFKKLNLGIEDLQVNRKETDSMKNFSFDNVHFSFAEYEYRTGDSLYLMGVKNVNYLGAKKNITISQLFIRPRLTEKEHATKLPYQMEINDLSLENISLEGVDIISLVDQGKINVQNALIQAGHWNVFLSRIPPPPPSKKKVVPSQKLLGISSQISICTLNINKLQLNYREFNTDTRKTGEIKFVDIMGRATNVTNEKNRIQKNPHLEVDLTAKLMGTADFKAKFDFLLDDTTGKFTVDAQLGKMDATQLNPAFIPLKKVEIKKGTLDEMKCHGSGNQNMLKGNVGLLYHDLHVAILEKDKEADTLKRRSFISLVANILVKNDNPKEDEPIRKANNVVLKREPRKSYFNLLLMGLFTGIAKIVAPK